VHWNALDKGGSLRSLRAVCAFCTGVAHLFQRRARRISGKEITMMNRIFHPPAILVLVVDGYRAKGMIQVESAHIPDTGHDLLADNPDAVAHLIEQYAGSDVR
jgi:hypothetical protein